MKTITFLSIFVINILLTQTIFAQTKLEPVRKFGYANEKGELVIDLKFDVGYPFVGGYAKVLNGELFNYIDSTGTEISDVWFEYAYSFSDNLALVMKEKKYGYILKIISLSLLNMKMLKHLEKIWLW
jgi:WG repeat protein